MNIEEIYNNYLKSGLWDLGEHMIFPSATHNSEPSWFGFAITLTSDKPDARQRLITYLDRHKIATRLLFGGNLINQPYFSGKNYRVHHPLLVTNKVLRNTFWIGVFPGLKIAHLDYVISVFHDYFSSLK